MYSRDGYLAKVAEMKRQAALCRPGVEHDALIESAAHYERMARLTEWRQRNPD